MLPADYIFQNNIRELNSLASTSLSYIHLSYDAFSDIVSQRGIMLWQKNKLSNTEKCYSYYFTCHSLYAVFIHAICCRPATISSVVSRRYDKIGEKCFCYLTHPSSFHMTFCHLQAQNNCTALNLPSVAVWQILLYKNCNGSSKTFLPLFEQVWVFEDTVLTLETIVGIYINVQTLKSKCTNPSLHIITCSSLMEHESVQQSLRDANEDTAINFWSHWNDASHRSVQRVAHHWLQICHNDVPVAQCFVNLFIVRCYAKRGYATVYWRGTRGVYMQYSVNGLQACIT